MGKIIGIVVVLALIVGGLFYSGVLSKDDMPNIDVPDVNMPEASTMGKANKEYSLKNYEGAIELFEQAIAEGELTEEQDAEAMYRIANCYEDMKDGPNAVKAYNAFLSAHPEDKARGGQARKRKALLE